VIKNTKTLSLIVIVSLIALTGCGRNGRIARGLVRASDNVDYAQINDSLEQIPSVAAAKSATSFDMDTEVATAKRLVELEFKQKLPEITVVCGPIPKEAIEKMCFDETLTLPENVQMVALTVGSTIYFDLASIRHSAAAEGVAYEGYLRATILHEVVHVYQVTYLHVDTMVQAIELGKLQLRGEFTPEEAAPVTNMMLEAEAYAFSQKYYGRRNWEPLGSEGTMMGEWVDAYTKLPVNLRSAQSIGNGDLLTSVVLTSRAHSEAHPDIYAGK
jgi:hypothetical protein